MIIKKTVYMVHGKEYNSFHDAKHHCLLKLSDFLTAVPITIAPGDFHKLVAYITNNREQLRALLDYPATEEEI